MRWLAEFISLFFSRSESFMLADSKAFWFSLAFWSLLMICTNFFKLTPFLSCFVIYVFTIYYSCLLYYIIKLLNWPTFCHVLLFMFFYYYILLLLLHYLFIVCFNIYPFSCFLSPWIGGLISITSFRKLLTIIYSKFHFTWFFFWDSNGTCVRPCYVFSHILDSCSVFFTLLSLCVLVSLFFPDLYSCRRFSRQLCWEDWVLEKRLSSLLLYFCF